MKSTNTKSLLLLCALCASMHCAAQNYRYLTFETSGGSAVSIEATGTVITFSGNTATVTNGDKQLTLNTTELQRMYFGSTDASTGISQVSATSTAPVELYTPAGVRVGSYARLQDATQLQPGVYIVKQDGRTYKTVVK